MSVIVCDVILPGEGGIFDMVRNPGWDISASWEEQEPDLDLQQLSCCVTTTLEVRNPPDSFHVCSNVES